MAQAERGELEGARGDGLGVMPSTSATPKDANTFAPRGGEHWPFEKRGDMYLVLTREPMLFLGIGMDLMHTSESIRCHVEYVGQKKRLLWYFRPGSPAYPPHGAPCDNMSMCLRCLAVLWTDDGLQYHRRFVITTDAFDPVGAQFYDMGMLQEFGTLGDTQGRPVLDKMLSKRNQAYPERNLYLGGTLLHWGIEQTQAPELIWTRDFLNFKRFKEHRRSFIDLGAPGAFDCGMVRPRYEYLASKEQWWHYYTGINTRHNGYTVMANKYQSPEELRKERPSRCYTQYFTTWEGDYADGKATRYLPGLAKSKPYRLACAEPIDTRGTLLSHPIRVQQGSLRINAATEAGGSISIEIQDAQGKAVLPAAKTFVGDQIDAEIADLSAWQGQAVRLHFVLDRARLFAFCL